MKVNTHFWVWPLGSFVCLRYTWKPFNKYTHFLFPLFCLASVFRWPEKASQGGLEAAFLKITHTPGQLTGRIHILRCSSWEKLVSLHCVPVGKHRIACWLPAAWDGKVHPVRVWHQACLVLLTFRVCSEHVPKYRKLKTSEIQFTIPVGICGVIWHPRTVKTGLYLEENKWSLELCREGESFWNT